MSYEKEITGSDLKMVGLFEVMLISAGNPDHGQNPYRSLPGVIPKNVPVKSLQEASEVCRKFIDDNELGAGNWSGGDIFKDDVLVARVSYNGSVWQRKNVAFDKVFKAI